MGLFARLFGQNDAAKPAAPYHYVPSSDAPQTIHLTMNGSPVQMTREDYRTQVLPGQFEQAWNDPGRLTIAVDMALRDEFVPDALEPARQLCRIDPQSSSAAIYLAATLIALKQNDEAGEVLTGHVERYGESGVILTNLAKVQANKGDEALSERTLWRALEKDPNQENGFFWYLAIQGERGGDAARHETLRKLAAVPGSWRAQLWLARGALDAGDMDAALEHYRQALQNADPAPADLLMQISGDLGNRGHLDRIIELCAAHFDPPEHGIAVGNNLIKAYIDLGDRARAKAIIAQLRALGRADWHDNLAYWENELKQEAGKT
jgi:tetratricopeptide (TPR) repeat protein